MAEKQIPIGTFTAADRWTKNHPAWIPEIDDGLIARYERLKKDLGIEKAAHRDGHDNVPAASETDLNETQLRIRDTAVEKISLLNAFLSDQLGIAAKNMLGKADRLDFANRELEATTTFNRALTENARLKRASEELSAAEQGLRYFVAEHHLSRAPHYVESSWLFAAIIFALLVVESLANGYILKEVSEGGWTGGVLLAMGISSVNVLLGIFGGMVGWRLIAYRHPIGKTIGWTVTVATLVGASIWNVFVAHYRQVAEAVARAGSQSTSLFDDPGQNLFVDAWRHMQEAGWLGLDSIWAWLLLVLGLAVFFTTGYKAWNDFDRYWDYRKYDLKRKKAEDDFEEECEKVMDEALRRVDEIFATCRKQAAEMMARAATSEHVADLAEQRLVEVADSNEQWIGEANRLLRFYRDENQKVRNPSLGVPAYWDRYPTQDEYQKLLARTASGGPRNAELINAQIATLRQKRAQIQGIVQANAAALSQFEKFAIGLKATAPDRVRELRSGARTQAERIVHERIQSPPPIGTPAALTSEQALH
jgi:hypothetical protein